MPPQYDHDSNDAHKNPPVEVDMALHRRGWKIQRIAWVFAGVFLLLAMSGLFGTGPLSKKSISFSGNTVKFERFMRYESESEIIFHVAGVKDTLRLSFPQDYLEYIEIAAIEPIPSRNFVADGTVTYYFPGSGSASIYCRLMAKKPGNISRLFRVNGAAVKIDHLIYP